jgi:hypothetical protein
MLAYALAGLPDRTIVSIQLMKKKSFVDAASF